MLRRSAPLALTAAIVLAMASGCSAQPAPVETTPGFASDEEAFAAAEETYRAYIDALNAVDLSDPATFEPVFALTTGEANANLRQELSQMHADRWSVEGASELIAIEPGDLDLPDTITATVCVDVSTVTLLDSDGESQVAPNRPDRQVTQTNFEAIERDEWKISAFLPAEDRSSCD